MYIYVYTCTIYYWQICLLWENDHILFHISPESSSSLLKAVEFETSVHASGSQELSMFTKSHTGHQTWVIYKRKEERFKHNNA